MDPRLLGTLNLIEQRLQGIEKHLAVIAKTAEAWDPEKNPYTDEEPG